MKKDPLLFICHILESIQLIEEYSANLTLQEFCENRSLQDAIIRRFEIMGEAVKNLDGSFKAQHPTIPWKAIAGMRDILIHAYFDVDLSLTWSVVKKELPPVKKYLLVLLKPLDSEER